MACKNYDNLQRRYFLAIVRGHVDFEIADIEYAVGVETKTADYIHRMMAIKSTELLDQCIAVRKAHTRALRLETGHFDKHPVTVLLLKPITGHRHQLRVHCNAIGHSIVGDELYNDSTDIHSDAMLLHCRRLLILLKAETLNIKEPIFPDPKIPDHYQAKHAFYKYHDDQDFDDACDVLDKSDSKGVILYKKFE